MFQPLLREIYIPEDLELKREDRHLAYTEWGNADNPNMLICVHGLSRNSRDFDYLANSLASDFHVICPDIVGRGRSSWLSNPLGYDIPHYIIDIQILLKKFQPKKLSWIGTSMGGLIGMGLAAANPILIHKMVLNDIGPFVDHTALIEVAKYIGHCPRFSSLEEAEKYCRQTYQSFGIVHDDDWRYFTKHSFTTDEEGYFIRAFDPAVGKHFTESIKNNEKQDIDLWAIWKQITCPTFCIHGTFSTILTQETLTKMKESGPPITILEIPNTGHAPALMDENQIKYTQQWLTS